MDYITSKTIEREVGLKSNTLHYYIKAGAIIPFDPGSGRGTQRRFSRKNLLEAVMLKHFIKIGFSKMLIVKIFQKINTSSHWKNLNPIDPIKQFVALELYLLGEDVQVDLIRQEWPGKISRIFEMTLKINQRCQFFNLVNLSAIASQYLRVFDQKTSIMKIKGWRNRKED